MISDAQRQQLDEKGYFVVRGILTTDQTEAIRAGLMARAQQVADAGDYGRDALLEDGARNDPEAVPLHERFRKLNELDTIPDVWNHWYAGPAVLEVLTSWLGPDILRKYCSAFLKPARVGGPTPWHQDIGLWRDTNADAANAWLAIDPATEANGCLVCVPGSHRGPVVEHVRYDNSIHAELPRERCENLDTASIELGPGDAVFWHSHLWHASGPNRSDTGRIGVGAVWVNPAQISQLTNVRRLRWAQRRGERRPHPAPELVVETQPND